MARKLFPGVGEAVAERTVLRPNESWEDVAYRVALGNSKLNGGEDFIPLKNAIADGRILLSGRHLQHGDENQPNRPMEVFTNCSTASQRSLLFYLLLNGSGVGTSYDDDMQVVNWSMMPKVICELSSDHADHDDRWGQGAECDFRFVVPDSREGWAYAVQFVEDLTYSGCYREKTVVLDFSEVRPKGSPIGGMQDRPSSGPIPLMEALVKFNDIRDARMPLWRQAMELDHLLAEIVLVGGARRAARIAVKWWDDFDIIEFINIKQQGGLWTANNSVGVDAEFWRMVQSASRDSRAVKAKLVFDACVEAQYRQGTGEPGFLNLDLISRGETHSDQMQLGGIFTLSATSLALREDLAARAKAKKYPVIVNPCAEIRLSVNGGYCVIGDVALAHCASLDEAVGAVQLTTRALLRTNTMDAVYQGEVNRTNRIGVALTGIHEFAWNNYGLTFHDLVEEGEGLMIDANGVGMTPPTEKARPFWQDLYELAFAVEDTAMQFCDDNGLEFPATLRTIKPSGTISKLFGLTEGAHLPSMREYLRWVQFRSDSPLVDQYREAGYPVRELETYKGTTIVGFPTRLPFCGDHVVTATEATPEQQIRWLRLLETFWLREEGGNQVSYTLKYDPKVVSEEAYKEFILNQVPLVRAVSIMPQIDSTAYEYQPEEPISPAQYEALVAKIEGMKEDVGLEHVDCASGACPIDFKR